MRVKPRRSAVEQNSARWALEVLGVAVQVYLDNPKHLAKKGGAMSGWALDSKGKRLSDKEAKWALAAIEKEGDFTISNFPNGQQWSRHGTNLLKQVDGKWYLCKP